MQEQQTYGESSMTNTTAAQPLDLDSDTLWEIHGVVKNSGSTRLAKKIADYIASRAAPATTGSASCADGGKCGVGGYCKDCPYAAPSWDHEEVPEGRASLAPVSAQQGEAVHQMRHKAGGTWTECDADGETCIKRMPHWADAYEFRTLYVGAAKAPAAQAVTAPTDEQIIAALHANGIDTYPSKYGFDAVQVSATSVPSLRNVLVTLAASPASTPEAAPEQQHVGKRVGFAEAMQAKHGPLTKEDLDACWSELPGYAWRRAAEAAHAQQPAAPGGITSAVWSECERIADTSQVDEALRGFSEDPTGDNGTMIVRAVIESAALWPPAAAPTAGAATTSEDAPLYSTRQDAARYRWLRNPDPQPHRGLDVLDDDHNIIEGKALDAAIDAAMRATQQEGA
jgi:hypothetical protein